MRAIAWLYFKKANGEKGKNLESLGLAAKVELDLKDATSGAFSGQEVVDDVTYGSFDEGGAFRGWHSNPDGSSSTNQDYIIGTYKGLPVVTNSLAGYYLKNYWYALSEADKLIARKIKFNDGTYGSDYLKNF